MAHFVKVISVLSIMLLCYAQAKKIRKMSFETPKLTDEEQESNVMPKQYRCEACRGISLEMQKALTKKINIYSSIREGKKELSEDQMLDLFEEICDKKDVFAVKTVEGVLELVYPGSKYDKHNGMRLGGGVWNYRFVAMCSGFVGDHDEIEIYRAHRNNTENGIFNLLCPKLCEDDEKKQKEEL